MAFFAPVCPERILSELVRYNIAGPYHLMLAHDVAADPKYKETCNKLRAYHQDLEIIMDNSVIELGGAVDKEMILEACLATKPRAIVLPDVLLDGKGTAKRSSEAIDDWYAYFNSYISWGHSFMYVPQGKTMSEWATCAEKMKDDPRIGWWGIPRNLVANVGSRAQAIAIAKVLNSKRKIHLLGFSDDLIDDFTCVRIDGVYGIDSAVPIRAANEDPPKQMSLSLDVGPRGSWWEHGEYNSTTAKNMRICKEMTGEFGR